MRGESWRDSAKALAALHANRELQRFIQLGGGVAQNPHEPWPTMKKLAVSSNYLPHLAATTKRARPASPASSGRVLSSFVWLPAKLKPLWSAALPREPSPRKGDTRGQVRTMHAFERCTDRGRRHWWKRVLLPPCTLGRPHTPTENLPSPTPHPGASCSMMAKLVKSVATSATAGGERKWATQ